MGGGNKVQKRGQSFISRGRVGEYLTDGQLQALESKLIGQPEKVKANQGGSPVKKKTPSLSAQLEQNLKDVKAYKSGKMKFRTTLVAKDGARTTWKKVGRRKRSVASA